MKKYEADRQAVIYLVIGILALPSIIFMLDRQAFSESPWILLPLIAPVLLVVWIFLDTSYAIRPPYLDWKSAFFKGRIEIDTIREIVIGKTLWSGIKPALSTNGLIIKYNRFDEVYISPKNKMDMVAHLLQLNPDIVISDFRKDKND